MTRIADTVALVLWLGVIVAASVVILIVAACAVVSAREERRSELLPEHARAQA